MVDVCLQDINNSGDGGVYAELVQKRAFQGDEVSVDRSHKHLEQC